ncbi:hypothetical protein HK099_005704 [Clydaea vesicula]|uniref:Glutathione S-transferase n=1 Tax=Clydaea vesicula TaxID=447962 RepID=A0AAD5TYV0_9FUNG|nr:hypothetical protein HK099_005704 [Clydaea vesicula]
MLTLYTATTPNGWKVSIFLEELKSVYGLDYNVIKVDMGKFEQKEESFLKMNPNGRIPTIDDDGFFVFESAAILYYLAEKYDTKNLFFPAEFEKRVKVMELLFFQMSAQGPMQGQSNHFLRYAPEDIPYAKNRYQSETKRIYNVYERILKDQLYLAGNEYTIADMCTIGWAASATWAGVELTKDEYPNVVNWIERVRSRPAVESGLSIPTRNELIFGDWSKAESAAEAGKKMIKDQIENSSKSLL